MCLSRKPKLREKREAHVRASARSPAGLHNMNRTKSGVLFEGRKGLTGTV